MTCWTGEVSAVPARQLIHQRSELGVVCVVALRPAASSAETAAAALERAGRSSSGTTRSRRQMAPVWLPCTTVKSTIQQWLGLIAGPLLQPGISAAVAQFSFSPLDAQYFLPLVI